MKRAHVGISISLDTDTSVWSNGLTQNLLLLARLLQHSPLVGQVTLLNIGSAEWLPAEAILAGMDFAIEKPEDLTHELDLVIEFGVCLPPPWVRRVRALGTRVVAMLVGTAYVSQVENSLFGRAGGSVFLGSEWDEVWLLPQHMKTNASMLRTIVRAPVVEMPHIWSPAFMQPDIDDAAARGEPFGFEHSPGKPWRVAIFEPTSACSKARSFPCWRAMPPFASAATPST